MLLLTDRPSEIGQLVAALAAVEPVDLVTPDGLADEASSILIICDVAFGNDAAQERLRSALDRSRNGCALLLCLLRDPSQLTFSRARDLGATAVLSSATNPVELVARVRQLLSAGTRVQASKVDVGLAEEIGMVTDVLTDVFAAGRTGHPVHMARLAAGAATVVDALKRMSLGPWLGLVRQHDDATFRHCLLVTGLTVAFSIRLGLTRDHQDLLAQAALVHDIGKAAIPPAILNKPGQLSAAETALIQIHPTRGEDMLSLAMGVDRRILDIVRHHHEFLDGSGYPDGLHGEQVSALVRMVTICDIYAALIERRPYKQPHTPAEAISILEQMGDKLDRGLVSLFRGMMTTVSVQRAA